MSEGNPLRQRERVHVAPITRNSISPLRGRPGIVLGRAEGWIVVKLDGDDTSTYLRYSEIKREASRV